jgi:hypothetical protein
LNLALASAKISVPVLVRRTLVRLVAHAFALVWIPVHIPRAVKADLACAPTSVFVPDLVGRAFLFVAHALAVFRIPVPAGMALLLKTLA